MTLTDQDALSPERAANLAENPYAGQGSVLLDIGGDVGAVVLHLPATYEGAEVAYRREGEAPAAHHHAHPHAHPHSHAPHVAVVGRPAGDGVAYTAVFPELVAGRYVLTLSDETELAVDVTGGAVAELRWPRDCPPGGG
jgi:hypothetical protein